MSNTTDPEMRSLIISMCKLTKTFDFPETVSFEQFPWVCYSCWEDRTYCLPSVLFGYKNVGNPYKKPYQTCKTEKTFKKHQNVLTGTHKKRQIFFHRFAGEYSLLLLTNHYSFFEGGEHKLGKLGCIGSHFFK